MSTKAERREKKRASREELQAKRSALRATQSWGWSRDRLLEHVSPFASWVEARSRLIGPAITRMLRSRRETIAQHISASRALLHRLQQFPEVEGGATITEPLTYGWKQGAVAVRCDGL
jgi:hypothetical protein